MTETTETPAGRWRKKPVVVEAHQLIDDLRNHTKIATWITVNGGDVDVPFAEPCLYIETLEGRMRADIGDWIIKGVKGEFHPVKPDIFAATYEPACRVCDGSGNLTVPDGDGESASEQACPDPVHDRQAAPELDDETPGYWHVRAALAISVHALQLVKLSDRDDLAKMAGETLAKVDTAMEGDAPDRLAGLMPMGLRFSDGDPVAVCLVGDCRWHGHGDSLNDATKAWTAHLAEVHRLDWPED